MRPTKMAFHTILSNPGKILRFLPGFGLSLSLRQIRRRPPIGAAFFVSGGERGIRTLDTGLSRIHTFQACSFNHSDTSPYSLTFPDYSSMKRSPFPQGDGIRLSTCLTLACR